MSTSPSELKQQVRDFWQDASCGEVYASGAQLADQLEAQAAARHQLEPYIAGFADFERAHERDVLEVGVGMGADHLEWAKQNPRSLVGIDLTPKAIEWTSVRLLRHGFPTRLLVSDAENLPFSDSSFDLVYSWGVLHHTPDTARAIREVHRVLRQGGEARLMLYHRRAVVGYLLWLRYALLAGRPRRSLGEIYAAHLESPGTKAYTVEEAQALLSPFTRAEVWTQLSFGDLLEGAVGQQHGAWLVGVAKALWPKRVVRSLLRHHGLLLLIRAVK